MTILKKGKISYNFNYREKYTVKGTGSWIWAVFFYIIFYFKFEFFVKYLTIWSSSTCGYVYVQKKWKIIKIQYYKGTVSKIKKYCKNYIYELFRISQCKTGNDFRKSQQLDFQVYFDFFFMNDCFV